MFETWRRLTYDQYERRIASADDFAKFEKFASGPWTPAIASKLPWDVLVRGPQMGAIDAQTRRVIDMEMARRAQPVSPIIANIVSMLALIVSAIALVRSL